MTQPTDQPAAPEEMTTVYWIGDPEVSAISVGIVDNLQIKQGKVEVPVTIALYLINVQPANFSPAPPAKAQAVAKPSTPSSAPKDPSEE